MILRGETKRRSELGLSLVELMVAGLLLAILSTAIFTYHSFSYWNDFKVRSKCLVTTQDKLDEMKVSDFDLLSTGAADVNGCNLQWIVVGSASPEFKAVTLITTFENHPSEIRLVTIIARPL